MFSLNYRFADSLRSSRSLRPGEAHQRLLCGVFLGGEVKNPAWENQSR